MSSLRADLPGTGRRAPWLAAAAVGTGLAADVALDPHHRHVPLCPLRALTGIWCPLCGGLRAADSLAHGQLAAALHENALFVASLPLLMIAWCFWLRQSGAGRARPQAPRGLTAAVVGIAVGFAVVRNLPFVPGLRGA